MIGRIHFVSGGLAMTATLEDDGRWTCDDDVIEHDLNTDLAVIDYSPAHGVWGYRQLGEAAKRYNGRIEPQDLPPSKPGRIY